MPDAAQRPPRRWLTTLAVVAVAGSLLVLVPWQFLGLSGDTATVWTTLVAAVFAVRAALLSSGLMRASWAMFSIFLAVLALSNTLREAPGEPAAAAPMLALIAFVPGAAAMFCYPILQFVRGMWRPVLMDAAVLTAGVIYLSHLLVLRNVYSTTSGVEAVALVVYPIASAMGGVLAILVFLRSEGAPRPDGVMIGATFCLYGIADNGSVLMDLRGQDAAGTWVDLLYTLAPLCLAAASLLAVSVPTPRRRLRRHLPGVLSPVVPDLVALGSIAVAAVIAPDDRLSHVLGVATIVAIGIRQIGLTSSSWQLRGALEERVEERTREMAELTEHYEQLDALKSEFITAASHELRTPLAAIRGALEMLEDGDAGELPPTAQRVVSIATRGSERLSRLVNDIIDLERLDSGSFSFVLGPHRVSTLVEDAVQSLAPLAAQQQITLRTEKLEGDAWCDPDRVVQVLVNLMANGLKFSEAGTTVTVGARVQGSEVLVSVRDQGRGIPANRLEKIFAQFHQVHEDDSREKGGAGLGLTICRRIVRGHGGRIWAESDGHGSTLRFTLPTASSRAAEDPAATAPQAVNRPARRITVGLRPAALGR